MSAAAPWSVKGIDPKAREVAKDLARRSGMTLGEWLNRVILEDDIPEEVTAEAQFADRPYSDRPHRVSEAPRLSAVPSSPDFVRVAFALDRLTDRIEASETRTGLAINGVEHSVRQALARIETGEREHTAAVLRVDSALEEAAAEQARQAERMRRLETEGGPRSAEALHILEARLADAAPEALAENVLERLGDRLALAESRTATALDDLRRTLGAVDGRLGALERSGLDPQVELRFEAMAQVLTHRVEAARAEITERLQSAGGPQIEARLAAMAETVRAAEHRSSLAVEEIGRQVLNMAEAVGRKLIEVDHRGAEAIDQVGTEVARIAGAVEQRLARAEHTQAEAFAKLGAELSRVTAALTDRLAVSETRAAEAIDSVGEQVARVAQRVEARYDVGPLAEAFVAAEPSAPPPAHAAPEAWAANDYDDLAELYRHELRAAQIDDAELDASEAPTAFSADLLSRSETEARPETVEAPWRRLELDVPPTDIPEAFAPIAETAFADADDELFEPSRPAQAFLDAQDEEDALAPSTPQISTREVIERARQAARDAGAVPRRVSKPTPRDVQFMSAGLLERFTGPKRRRQNTALQTALLVAGGAAFLSVGAAGLTLMQGARAPQHVESWPFGKSPRLSVALSPGFAGGQAATNPPGAPLTFEQIRGDVEAGVPGALTNLKALSDLGHPQAQLYLAQLYDLGEAGVPQNPAEARRLVTLAAQSGDVHAMHNLGVYYFRGEGGAQDLVGAAQWFQKAAAAGVVESQYNLGLLYQSGSGVPRDLVQARHWFGEAAAKGDAEARKALAALQGQAAPRPAAATAHTAPAHKPQALAKAAQATVPAPAASQNVRQTQLLLARLGYYEGPADGFATAPFQAALADYQRDQGGLAATSRPYAQR